MVLDEHLPPWAHGATHAPEEAVAKAFASFERPDMNRWIESKGPLQMRKELAFVNLGAVKNLNIDFREKLAELGFSVPQGLLVDSDLVGPVYLFMKRT